MTPIPGLTGVVWHLTRLRGEDGSEVVIDDPSRYSLEIRDDGSAVVRADCNRGMGTATVDGSSITIRVGLTRVLCPPGSHSTAYARYLLGAVGWTIRDGQLQISLPADAGVASFVPEVPPGPPTDTPATD